MRKQALVSIAFALGASVATAQAPDAARAEELFRAGRAAERAGDSETACTRFAESERVLPTPAASINLALCDERAGRLARAWKRYRELSSTLPAEDPRLELAGARLLALEPRLARVSLARSRSTPADVQVELDGAALAEEPFGPELIVDPGKHVLTARAAGHREFRDEFELDAGEQRSVALEMSPLARESATRPRARTLPPAPAPAVADGSTDSQTTGWVVLGAGGAALAVGAVAGLLVLDRKATMDEHCDGNVACDSEGLAAAESGRTFSIISTIGVGAGAVGVGVGVYLLTRGTPARKAELRIVPGGLSLVGRL